MTSNGFLNADEIHNIGFSSIGLNPQIDRNAVFYGAERISLGSNVRIDAFSVLSAGSGGIEIGNHVHIAAFVLLVGSARIVLHDFCGLSSRVSVYSSNDDYLGSALTGPTVPDELRMVNSEPVIVGRHVVVGAGSVILPGVTISEGACVGALSLIKRNVNAFTIVVGSEGKVVRMRKSDFLALESELPTP